MIRKIYGALLLMSSLLLMGCPSDSGGDGADDVTISSERIDLDPTSVEFLNTGGSQSVTIKANCRWTISNIPNWVVLNRKDGSGDATITLSVEANTGAERSHMITVGSRERSVSLTVRQRGAESDTPQQPTTPTIADGTYDLNLGMFHVWNGCSATSTVLPDDAFGEIHLGEVIEGWNLIYGNVAVWYNRYADITGYDKLVINGTPGMTLRILINRMEIGNGESDEHGGSFTLLTPVIEENGTAVLDLTSYPYVHLNAIKTKEDSPQGRVKSLMLVKGAWNPVTLIADAKSMVEGGVVPTLTYQTTGGTINGIPIISTTVTPNSPAGTYPIIIERGSVITPQIVIIDGTMTVFERARTEMLTADFYHVWTGCSASSTIKEGEDAGCEIRIGENLSSGLTVYGNTSVYYYCYADLTGYKSMTLTGTPGLKLRILMNRLEVGNGGGDSNGGGWTELNPVIGTGGSVSVDLTPYDFVHLNAIKNDWESSSGVIEKIEITK